MSELVTLQIKIPRNTEITPEAAQTFLSTMMSLKTATPLQKLLGKKSQVFALEIVLYNQQILFQITCDTELKFFVETQIVSNYPLATVTHIVDPIAEKIESMEITRLFLKEGNYYPLATFASFNEIDPLSSVLSVLTKGDSDIVSIIQFALEPADSIWQTKATDYAAKGDKKEDGSYSPRSDQSIIKEKVSYPGFRTSLRVASTQRNTLKEMADAFKVFTKVDGNAFTESSVSKFRIKTERQLLLTRTVGENHIFNIAELATLWHLPNEKIKTAGIVWGSKVLSEAPENLPVATNLSDEDKKKINFFGKAPYKNEESIFGIRDNDRMRHIWTVGKTGTGKSTMIANMAIDDIKKDRGIGVIDPHGDLVDDILDFIPAHRINDTVVFNPADKEFPVTINPLEVRDREEAELVVSGIMSIFTKVWANVWSARMEYILRNSLMTLSEVPDATLMDVLKILSDQSYRNKVVGKIKDTALISFWKDEFDKMPEALQKEAISPIQNKVGQFVTSPLIRRIIGVAKSSIQVDEIMDGKKILLANLSQGRLGEDNAALLGAILITKFQVAAMRRVDKPNEERTPFYLYVDEFQNFATSSFIKILSEARKYKLGITLANQYMAQIPPEVQKAILGNAGTLISFGIGAEDASIVHKEYAEVFTQNDLVNIQNYQIAIKLMIDGHSTRPFMARTLPLPEGRNQNRAKVIQVSRERWGKKIIE